MSTSRVILRNVFSNWTGFAVHLVVTFFLTPFVLRSLGDARYGVWALIMGLTGYYGLLDLGFRSGLTQYLARYLATRNYDQMNRTASTGFVTLCTCAMALLAISAVLAACVHWILALPPETVTEVRWSLLIIGSSIALQFVFFVYSAVFSATQRFDLANLIGISTRVVSAAATYVVLARGGGLVALSLVVGCSNLLDYLLRWRVARMILPELRISPRLAQMEFFWQVTHFGIWNVLIAGSVTGDFLYRRSRHCGFLASHRNHVVFVGGRPERAD